LEDEDD
jgi:Ran GTPase-activating protein (RanGAP) involved in mRNA processing and transport